jgi:hypothetical protein
VVYSFPYTSYMLKCTARIVEGHRIPHRVETKEEGGRCTPIEAQKSHTNLQTKIKWSIVSLHSRHRPQMGSSMMDLRYKLALQFIFYWTRNQVKKQTRGGAQFFQMKLVKA